MARIRSVHPSLFTDEAWVSCSPMARILYIGLWTDADDQGLFEWKPLQLRMRLLPGDSVDVQALLEELAGANLIAPLESAGKKLGAIRYFRRFQRPKKPTASFVLPPEWGKYVGLNPENGGTGSELEADEAPPVPHQFPTSGEKSIQMEDGGWRKKDGEEDSSANADSSAEASDSDLFGDEKPKPEAKPVDEVKIAFAEWNTLAARLNFPLAEKITDARRKSLKARLADGGLPKWREALKAVEASAFCRGLTSAGFRADIDFVLRPSKFQKLIEGGFGREHTPAGTDAGPAAPTRPPFPGADLRAQIADRLGEPFTRAWLDPCRWRAGPPRPQIIAPSQTVADRLKREAWAVITGAGAEIIVTKGAG